MAESAHPGPRGVRGFRAGCARTRSGACASLPLPVPGRQLCARGRPGTCTRRADLYSESHQMPCSCKWNSRANRLTRPALNAVFRCRVAGSVAEPSCDNAWWRLGHYCIPWCCTDPYSVAITAPWVLSSLTYSVRTSINQSLAKR